MNNEAIGKELKRLAKSHGNFIHVDIADIYNTLDTLSYFFYRKKHEWIAICFIDEEFICRLIWFNKGVSRQATHIGLSPEEAITQSENHNTKYIILAHNHPVSSFDLQDYGSRRLNIQASYDLKAGLLDFSEQDKISGNMWYSTLDEKGIRYADAVFVAGEYKISGNAELIENYEGSKPSSRCFISTSIFGERSYETSILRSLRGNYLMNYHGGKLFCKYYYFISPKITKYIIRNSLLNLFFKILILLFVRVFSKKLITVKHMGKESKQNTKQLTLKGKLYSISI